MNTDTGTPATPSDGGSAVPEPTPKLNVTIKKDAPTVNRGPGFVTVSDGFGKSIKLKVNNIGVTLEEISKDPKVVEFTKVVKGKLKISKRRDVNAV